MGRARILGAVAWVAAVLAGAAAPRTAMAQFDLPGDEAPASAWRARVRLLPTITTTYRSIESGSGFGLELSAERPLAGDRVAPYLGLALAGDDRKTRGCLTCREGRMSAYLLTGGVTLRPAPAWPVVPWLEASAGAGAVTWSLGTTNVPAGIGIIGGTGTGGGLTWRAGLGAGLEGRWGDRVVGAGVSRAMVWERRWDGPRAVTTLLLGLRMAR